MDRKLTICYTSDIHGYFAATDYARACGADTGLCCCAAGFVHDGNSLVEWNMTKEKYLELFPPVLRFTSCQNTLGNCYFATSLFSSMEDRYARPNIYKSFELKGDDVVVTVKAYEDYNGSYTYKNGNIELPTTEDYMSGCKGLQMYEQAYARTTLRVDYMDHLPKISQK